jgi:hypothetical protein
MIPLGDKVLQFFGVELVVGNFDGISVGAGQTTRSLTHFIRLVRFPLQPPSRCEQQESGTASLYAHTPGGYFIYM